MDLLIHFCGFCSIFLLWWKKVQVKVQIKQWKIYHYYLCWCLWRDDSCYEIQVLWAWYKVWMLNPQTLKGNLGFIHPIWALWRWQWVWISNIQLNTQSWQNRQQNCHCPVWVVSWVLIDWLSHWLSHIHSFAACTVCFDSLHIDI